MKPDSYSIERLNENSLLISFGDRISPETCSAIQRFSQALYQTLSAYVLDTVPSYTTLMIVFDDDKIAYSEFFNKLSSIPHMPNTGEREYQATTFKIPVLYNHEFGLDLAQLAKQKDLSESAVIRSHCSRTYTVYAIGFTPGFAFLGEVEQKISHPRKTTPRQKLLAGSVGIAGTQTGIYPVNSPGGWNIIGRTPLTIITPQAENICPIHTGDKIQFHAIDDKRFVELQNLSLMEYMTNA